MKQDLIDHAEIKKKINLDNFEELSFDEFDFKPINRGLGFHHNEKKNSFKKEANSTTRTHIGKMTAVEKVTNLGISQDLPEVANRSSLSAFYGEESPHKATQQPKVDTTLPKVVMRKSEASVFMCFVAWLVDIILISFFAILTIGLFSFSSGIEFSQLLKLITFLEKVSFVAMVFGTYYVLYFSILDLTSSPGKALLGLSIEKSDQSELRFKDTLVRAIVSFFSLIFLGTPHVFQATSKLSQTRVTN